jgi:hypothetical protein
MNKTPKGIYYFNKGLSLTEVEQILVNRNDPENQMGRFYVLVSPDSKEGDLTLCKALIKNRVIQWMTV